MVERKGRDVLAWGQPVPICALVISCGGLEIFVGAGKEAN